jgi:Ca2+:H+ antiporter
MNVVFGLLMLAIPGTIAASYFHLSPMMVMALACLGIVPVANYMGQATEHMSHHVGPTAGGLMNATFGNACELIIALVALKAGMIEVVKASLTGAILGNVLLVMGASMVAGGLKHEVQTFNKFTAMTASTLLTVVAFSLMMPAALHHFSAHESQVINQNLALAISIVLMALYLCGLLFSLGTHSHLFLPTSGAKVEEADGEKPWSVMRSLVVLLFTTVAVAVLSEYLVGSVQSAAETMGMTPMFVGVIVLAFIGNVAENSTAIKMARKNKMDIAINVALGSSTQIAMFVTPVIVVAGLIIGQPMDLLFTPAEIASVMGAVIVCWLVIQDGKSNWFEGAALLALYAILGITFYFIR